MSKKTNTSTNKLANSDAFLKFFGLENFEPFLTKILKYAKKHFTRFSTILVAITTVGIWIIRAFGYSYQSGKLATYNIDKSYILLNDNFFLQIIEFLAVGIIFILINYIYFYTTTREDNTKFQLKRKFRKLVLYTTEMFFLLLSIILQTDYGVEGFIKEVQGYSFLTWITLIIILFLIIFCLNILGIQIVHSTSKKSTDNTTNISNAKENLTKSYKQLTFIKTALVFLSILLILAYIWGIFEEKQRTTFKIIPEQTEENLTDSTVFTLQDNNSYFFNIVVYENENVYILCRLCKSNNEIKIDTDYQKIISKNNIETYNVSNIYKISYKN